MLRVLLPLEGVAGGPSSSAGSEIRRRVSLKIKGKMSPSGWLLFREGEGAGSSASGISPTRLIISISFELWRVTLGGNGGNFFFPPLRGETIGGNFFSAFFRLLSLSMSGCIGGG